LIIGKLDAFNFSFLLKYKKNVEKTIINIVVINKN
jgi:hypothetical protein